MTLFLSLTRILRLTPLLGQNTRHFVTALLLPRQMQTTGAVKEKKSCLGAIKLNYPLACPVSSEWENSIRHNHMFGRGIYRVFVLEKRLVRQIFNLDVRYILLRRDIDLYFHIMGVPKRLCQY